ncbi:NrsF family protein [Pseudoruegeria sp. HB172150]|uniref:NrsF family protein n=1 Tax=Pseudoruegeria sp. HB172150 TaxID=2721164 RepID=UPI0015565826|nr:DUF1109 domain-containing protein [Pseudoruegeria sp. HB172150]
MKTEDLIATLATEAPMAPSASLERRAGLGVAFGGLVTLTLFFVVLGPRPGLLIAMSDPFTLAKTILPLLLAPLALIMSLHAARPAVPLGVVRWLALIPPVSAAGLFLWAFSTTGAGDRFALFIGHSIQVCLPAITILSLPIIAGLLGALRHGAPVRPARCGALAGLASAGIATAIYSTFCVEDSPLFYAVWYSLGIGIATGIGALLGMRYLRW